MASSRFGQFKFPVPMLEGTLLYRSFQAQEESLLVLLLDLVHIVGGFFTNFAPVGIKFHNCWSAVTKGL